MNGWNVQGPKFVPVTFRHIRSVTSSFWGALDAIGCSMRKGGWVQSTVLGAVRAIELFHVTWLAGG
jgi:hypothetical protein